ncbi:hypothetical protein TRVL_07509 [Trypanosoma vivax]|nr:hypothetical protein TRVL_07509 [Trypanosoma vivax]
MSFAFGARAHAKAQAGCPAKRQRFRVQPLFHFLFGKCVSAWPSSKYFFILGAAVSFVHTSLSQDKLDLNNCLAAHGISFFSTFASRWRTASNRTVPDSSHLA